MNRKPENNKALIDNFILHLTHCDRNPDDGSYKDLMRFTPEEMYQACDDYIKEDHVDGYERDEEILINTWLKAEEFNRNGDVDKAIELKDKFSTLYKKDWIDREYVDAYLESIGG